MTHHSYTSSTRPAGHPLIAILLAGPIFVTGLGITAFMTAAPAGIVLDTGALFLPLLAFNPFTIMFGALLAIVPNLIGGASMRWLGRRNVAMQFPAAWALAGGLIGGAVTAAAAAGSAMIVAMSFTGAICALICRHGVVWDDDVPLSDGLSPAIGTA